MAYKPPINTPLTETQSQVLSKFGALKTYLSVPKKKDLNVSKDQQMSSFDFLMQMAYSVVGASLVDILIKSFLNKLFDGQRLENIIIKAIVKTLGDKNLSSTESNEEWVKNKISGLIDKKNLVLLIIAMIFGPKKKMQTYAPNTNADDLLNAATCCDQIFSLSNNPSEPQGNIEYNKVQLKKRLEEGNVEFIISCQSVKIKLPDNLEEALKTDQVINPADIFVNLNNYVSGEIHKQNVPSNVNAINKSFMQTINEKMFNIMPTAIGTQLDSVFNEINAIQPNSISYSSCDIVNCCDQKDSQLYKEKSAFSSALLNMMYAFLISIFFTEITNIVKRMIKQMFAESAKRKMERRLAKQKQRAEFLDKSGKILQQSKMTASALKSIDSIFDEIKNI